MSRRRKRRRGSYEARFPNDLIAKITGADIELGNFVVGLHRAGGSGPEASRLLLRAIDGIASRRSYQLALWRGGERSAAPYANVQDYGRKYLMTNGSCAYIDLDHLEICIPEVFSAFDHVAAVHAMYSIVGDAIEALNAAMPDGMEVKAIANNSDGESHSFGAHVNFLVSRRAWDDIFHFKPHYLQLLASHQVSSIIYTGQGKVGSENERPWVPFQLSQRADFFETLQALQTTYARPIVNSRDEPLCGGRPNSVAAGALARLHVIFFDSTMCHVAGVLKVGAMQLVLAMIEAGVVPLDVLLDDPLAAVGRWSRDPTLNARAALACGEDVTAVELQRRFLEHARRFAEANDLSAIVPRAGEILMLWDDVLTKLETGKHEALAGSLDWVLKLQILARALERDAELDWRSPAIQYLDQTYASLDHREGLYWKYERAGIALPLVSPAQVRALVEDPPRDTRAWCRAMLLRLGAERTSNVNWDAISFDRAEGYGREAVNMDDPRRFTEKDCAALFDGSPELDVVVEALQDYAAAADGELARPGAISLVALDAGATSFDLAASPMNEEPKH